MRSVITFLLLFPAGVFADTFGSEDDRFDIEFLAIGSPGNFADSTGYGSVPYAYRIGRYAVSREMVETYNELSGGPVIEMSDMSWYGGNRPACPATVSWNGAARFVN